MFRKKKILIIASLIVLAGAIAFPLYNLINTSFTSLKKSTYVSNAPVNDKSNPKKKKLIGIVVMNYINEYWNDLISGVKAYSEEAGYEVEAVDVHDSVDIQVQSVDQLIDKGADGIIVAAINETALEPVIHKAMKKGIKVIGHLHDLKEYNVLYGPKEYDMGLMAGRYMGKLLKEKGINSPKLAMLTYPALGTLIDREKGLEDGLREFVPEATIIAKPEGHTPELGEKAAREILGNEPGINGFVGINDNGLLGALKAYNETIHEKRDDFFIVGIGGDSTTLEKIKSDSPFKATVNIDPWLNGYNEARFMKEMFDGKAYSNKIVYFSPLTIIDKSNVDGIIKEKGKRNKQPER